MVAAMTLQETMTQPDSATATGTPADADIEIRGEKLLHREDDLHRLIRQVAGLLPMPGPITAFAFLNTLQEFENHPFDEGMRRGARLYGCEPYLAEDDYREKLRQGRIRVEDLSAVLLEHLGDDADRLIGALGTRFTLRLSMLQYRLRSGPYDELRWYVAEMDALLRLRSDVPDAMRKRLINDTRHWVMRDLRNGRGPASALHDDRDRSTFVDLLERFDEASIESWSDRTWEAFTLQALWRVCRRGVQASDTPPSPTSRAVRHRDALLDATGEDADALVNSMLIRFCAAFTDQGFAGWSLARREAGFFTAFCELYQVSGGPPDRWLRGLPRELARITQAGLGPVQSILESLDLLGVTENEWDDFIPATLMALRGWAGMLWQMEVRADRVAVPVPKGTLVEFLAVRLILERLALEHVARTALKFTGPVGNLRDVRRSESAKPETELIEQRSFLVFQLAQILGWSPPELLRLPNVQWKVLVGEIEAFAGLEQRWVFQLAFERGFRLQTLDALAVHTQRTPVRIPKARFQTVYCIDAREESFRRHLEEIAPDTETFGTAGFYGVAMYYRGVSDAHFAALCPIVILPRHWVVEEVVYSLEEVNRRRARTRQVLGTASHQVHVGSRSIASGALLTGLLGVLASVPLVARVLFPRLTARVRKAAGRFVAAPIVTRLRLERSAPTPGPEGDQIGYSLEELTNIGERMLRDIGLTSGFARLVIFLGHGSFCLNNPHKSAYDCGACSGMPGGPNGRALAAILNDRRVRETLASRGLSIPDDTVFLGGLHNTAVDSVTFADLDLLPKSHIPDFEDALRTLEEVCKRNAHERCRRFDSAPLNLSFEAAHQHVEQRSEDLAQTRPEFGNASNAICIVGRRERTRGLYLDRRSFLTSYDPTQDDAEYSILARILAAVIPVCEGINMQYYLSYVDSPGWACGTKLPHNVTALLGVMDGAASDLRPGLPWQSVEIHEPVRLLFVIETTPQAMFKIMANNDVVGRILMNGWAQLAVLDPGSNKLRVFRNGEFHAYEPENTELPKAASSTDWYRGWRDHLGFALIEG